MSKISLKPNDSGTGTFTLESPNSNTNRTLTLPDEAGTMLVGVSANTSTDNTVTHKIPVVVDGVTYYLLATTSSS
jgi:hypothetical protein